MWQDVAAQDLAAPLQADEDVRAIVVYGSCALSPAEKDMWSDVDLLVVISEPAISRYLPQSVALASA
ncbi:MAG TPA: nucleotidyltransferase domain-containing protein [Pyrinomonadaceae bacterium]|jgi:predicted nucleotidyltransferase